MQVFYSLISSLKTYHRTLHFTPWSLDLFIHVPFQLPGEHTVLQPFRRIELIVHIAISVLPGTHFHLSQVKHLRVKCIAQGHTILTMSYKIERGETCYFSENPAPSTAGSDIGRALHSNHCAMSLSSGHFDGINIRDWTDYKILLQPEIGPMLFYC